MQLDEEIKNKEGEAPANVAEVEPFDVSKVETRVASGKRYVQWSKEYAFTWLRLFMLAGKSYDFIANQFGVNIGNVRNAVSNEFPRGTFPDRRKTRKASVGTPAARKPSAVPTPPPVEVIPEGHERITICQLKPETCRHITGDVAKDYTYCFEKRAPALPHESKFYDGKSPYCAFHQWGMRQPPRAARRKTKE